MLDRSPAVSAHLGRRVLVVDDDHDFADSLCNLLTLEGYDVHRAYGASQACDVLDDFLADVALIDIRLGRQNGIALISELREHRPNVMCIMMTAYASAETAIEALQEGAYDYLCKPFFPEDLLATLERGFERIALARGRDAAEAALRSRNLELERINARLHRVVNSMQALSTRSTLSELYPAILEEVVRNMGANGGAIYLSEGERLVLKHAHGRGHAPRPGEPPDASEAIAQVLRSGLPLLAPAEEVLERIGGAEPSDPGGQAALVFPLTCDTQKPIGVLCIYGNSDHAFTQQDQEFGLILTSFACEAIRVAQGLESLAQSEKRLRSIIENSPSAIALLDLAGRYLVVNRRFEEWFEVDSASVPGKTPREIFPRPLAELLSAQESEVLEDKSVIDQQLEIPFADGATHVVLATKFPVLDANGQPVGVGTIATDVTDHRRSEEQLRQSQKMEALGQLTGGVAHDFNNILAVVLGNLELLKDELAPGQSQHELLEDALDSAGSGAELTHRLLAFGRRQTLYPRVTDVRDLVGKTSRLLARTLGETIEIRKVLPEGLWPIEVDRNQLETTLLNLAINARDAMLEGGTLTLEASNLHLERVLTNQHDRIPPGQYVLISVRDTGAGMTPGVMERAFQPFFTTKEVGAGSGLGLSMVYGFVKQSMGHVGIASGPAVGTTVKLFLPRAKAERPALDMDPPDVHNLRGEGETVLVVEDDPRVRKLVKNMLDRLGYRVAEAGDAEAALALLEDGVAADLLFTDIALPRGMSGLQLAREALARHPHLKVLYASGNALDALGSEGAAVAARTLVKKPFRREELARAVRDALAGGGP